MIKTFVQESRYCCAILQGYRELCLPGIITTRIHRNLSS